ncbi:MAG TPA: preprotein translocase subunit YajC [Gemmatimonadales bacterium]|nr:preprotein translocase subunit YajC [Gemmatimonadales bacterium]
MILPLYALIAPTPQGAPGGGGLTVLLLQILGIGLVFYFFIIRPQSQARKRHEALLAGLKKGDEVTTSGGLIGKVKDIRDDRVMVESGTATVVVERGRIARIGPAGAQESPKA